MAFKSSKTAAGVTGRLGHPAPSPVVLVSSPVSVCVTPPPPSLEARAVQERVDKLRSVRSLRARVSSGRPTALKCNIQQDRTKKSVMIPPCYPQSMGTGGLGHRGTRALLPVAVAYNFVSVSAMTPNQNMAEKIVLVMPKTSRRATTNPARLVRHLLYLINFH